MKIKLAKKSFILLFCIFFISACNSSDDTTPEPIPPTPVTKPNIIFIYTDDHGYADLSTQGVVSDIKTPAIDQLAASGIKMTNGYSTAPQCTPSRAALMTGRYQQKFGTDDNAYTPMPQDEPTLAEKLVSVGYKTGMAGKWHLELDGNSKIWYQQTYAPGSTQPFNLANIPLSEKIKYFPESKGFQEYFYGYLNNYRANFDLAGNSFEPKAIVDNRFRVDVVSDAAVAFINKHKTDPFFLYVSYYAPHTPLEATQKYLSMFPESMPERRRYALAMLAAIDEGVGRIVKTLQDNAIDEKTIIFFMSDNGAPLAIKKEDLPILAVDDGNWDGSLNNPWIGEKGMLTEGGIRVPYIVRWKGHLPAGKVYEQPIITLDATKTAASLAGADSSTMDGVNIIPYLNNFNTKINRSLFWRFWNQSAVRKDNWKYIKAGSTNEYLFDLSTDIEKTNLISQRPEIANEMKSELEGWAASLKRQGVPNQPLNSIEKEWYNYYLPTN